MKTFIIHLLIITFSTLLILSCKEKTKDKQIIFSHFPKEDFIKGVKIKKKIPPLKLFQIEKIDSLLIAFDFYRKDKRIFIFNINNFSLIESAGIIGHGPKELTRPFFFDIDKKNNIIWIGDRGKLKIFGFSIDSIIKSEKQLATCEANINKDYLHFTRIRYFKDSIFAIAEGTPQLLRLVNFQGEIIENLGDIPEKRKKGVPKFGFSTLWKRNLRIVNDNRFLISFLYFDKIMMIDSIGNTIFLNSGPDNITQRREFTKKNYWKVRTDSKRGYGPCYQHGEYIYCLYSGKSIAVREDYEYRQQYYQRIHVFDLAGNPIFKLNLNHEIRDFVIDDQNNRIIGISPSIPETFITFPLPNN